MFIVTGANGFIGSAMVRELNARGHKDIICVDVVDIKERAEPLKRAIYAEFMTTPQFLKWTHNLGSRDIPKAIFHMGAISSTTETVWSKLQINNIDLSTELYNFCREKDVALLYASSGAVYGLGDKGFSDQSDSLQFAPLNLYGKSKKDFDVWVAAQSKTNNKCLGLRFFNVYGPNEYHKEAMASVVYKAFVQIKSSGKLRLFKSHNPQYLDGEQLRDFVYIKDITRWMWELYENTQVANGIYNLGYGKSRTWLDLAKNVFANMNSEMSIDWIDIPMDIRNQYQYFTEADMKKSFATGLSKPLYSLELGIQDYIQNYLITDQPYI